MVDDFESCYRAIKSRDTRFDGWFVTAVRTTGIFCRPSCPARTPRRENVVFYPTTAAAQQAGFRACKRCVPDAAPTSPRWRHGDDVVARAMRLIADGVVDRDGVDGLARRLGYSARHLNRRLVDAVGAGPAALAGAQRAHTARALITGTDLPMAQLAFAAGFGSIRQFNDAVRAMYGTSPTDLRRSSDHTDQGAGSITLRLAYRAPMDPASTLGFAGDRTVTGVESYDGGVYRRTLRLPRGHGLVRLEPADGHVRCDLHLTDLRDLRTAAERCRRLLDLDADPAAIVDVLRRDRVLAGLVRRRPGLRVPGTVDGSESLMRAILGQQVSVAAARTLAGRLVARVGTVISGEDGLTHLFPTADAIAGADLDGFGMPGTRVRTLQAAAAAVAEGDLELDPGAERAEVAARLLALPGIGPWTVAYVAMRALGDPDAFPVTDLGLRRALEGLGIPADPKSIELRGERWRPWRAYATCHLWASLSASPTSERNQP